MLPCSLPADEKAAGGNHHVHPQRLVRRRLGRRNPRDPARPPHLQRACRPLPRPAKLRRGTARHVLPSWCAAAHGSDRRGRPAMRLSRPDLRPLRRLRPRPRPDAHPRAHPRPQLPRGGAGRVRVDLDGRSHQGRCVHHRTLAVPQRYEELAAQTHDVSHQGRRHADGGQPDGPDASRLRPYHHHRRQHVEAKMQTERTPLGLNFTRWMLNSVPPPTYVKAVGFQGRIDRCQRFEFIAPGSILQWTGAAETGAYSEGDTSGSPLEIRLFHGLTPETDTSCFYFWSAANGFRQDEPAATEQLFAQVAAAFLEDKTVVEGQQLRLTELGEAALVDIATDAA